MESVRKPFQGVGNILRFNWPYYALSLIVLAILVYLVGQLPESYCPVPFLGGVLLVWITLSSLAVSWYVYDHSALYRLDWSGECPRGSCIVNIHAGFDETSALLLAKYPDCDLVVLDFFDPARHTEASIRRARSVNAQFAGTRTIDTAIVPLPDASAARIFLTLAAHEIRCNDERATFFRELRRILKPDGRIFVTEHLRDLPNVLAYTIGFLHFLSRRTWARTFREAGLKIIREQKTTPFITTFILESDGTAP
jgi:SAM-dependent methyltransferase